MKAKIKTYVLTVSRNYPKTHPRKGQETGFAQKIKGQLIEGYESCECGWEGLISELDKRTLNNGVTSMGEDCFVSDDRCPNCHRYVREDYYKIHTIRTNYNLWDKRIKEVQEGLAILSIRYWSGKPYNSKQIEICKLDKDSGIGVQKLRWLTLSTVEIIDNGTLTLLNSTQICKNDGLSLDDFESWFKGYDLSEPMAIIHFTKFRY